MPLTGIGYGNQNYIQESLAYCKNRKLQHGNGSEKFNELIKASKNEENEKADDAEGSKTDSEVIVKPDGSRVLITTTQVGGMEMVMSLKISEPAGSVNPI